MLQEAELPGKVLNVAERRRLPPLERVSWPGSGLWKVRGLSALVDSHP